MLFKKYIKRITTIFIAAIICAIAIQYFITPASTVPTEVLGVMMAITSTIFKYDTQPYLILFWCLYFIAMIPFFVFGYFKISKEFVYLSIWFVFVTTIFGLFFSSIKTISTFEIFGKWQTNNNLGLRFSYASCGAVLYGLGLGITLIYDGSSGGTDIVSKWLSQKGKKHISFWLAVFAIITLMFSTFIFEILGFQHKYQNIPFNKINYLNLFITFSFSLWTCILGPIIVYSIFKIHNILKKFQSKF